MGHNPVPPPPALRSSFRTWVEWASDAYVRGAITLDEFESMLDKHIGRFLDDDRWWSPLPGGLPAVNGDDGRLIVDGIDFTFERDVDNRLIHARGARRESL